MEEIETPRQKLRRGDNNNLTQLTNPQPKLKPRTSDANGDKAAWSLTEIFRPARTRKSREVDRRLRLQLVNEPDLDEARLTYYYKE